jgi:magnesium-transporting ATPase (P-type)
VYCTLTEVFLNLTEVLLTLTEVFPCFFLSCKANATVKLAKTGHGPHSSTLVVISVVRLLFVLFCVLCVNVYCHRVTTQLQLINISYHITSVTGDKRTKKHLNCGGVPMVVFSVCIPKHVSGFSFSKTTLGC